ncbi:MAG TPA: XrtA system polysaccharide deacetylase [Bacteroidota bacterium]
MKNAMSVDLEDWFCVSNFNDRIPREQWDRCELRVERSTTKLLDLLDAGNAKATFFVLGWIAERVPALVREIERRGHEIAIHGYHHLQITKISREEFANDLEKAIEAVRKTGIQQIPKGFRAPSFSITEQTQWAYDILEQKGFQYDSSVFPVKFHPDYGIPDAPLAPYRATRSVIEIPLSCISILGQRLPCCGGAYFRFAPYYYTKQAIRRCQAEGRPVIFYIHPWEFDPGQPRVQLPYSKRLRHYFGIAQTEKKFKRLLSDFQFTSIKEMLAV